MIFRETFTQAGWKLAQCYIWAKQSFVMGRQDYHWQHEPILYGWKPTGPHKWYSDRKQSTLWQFQKPTKNLEHPTMKPIELISYPLQNSSKKKYHPGPIRRKRQHTNSRRTNTKNLSHHGVGSSLLRCNHQPMGRIHRTKS
jgi:hypothetical protein